MKKILFFFFLAVAACTSPPWVPAQNLPEFKTPDDAKTWIYTVKPTQLLDYLVWASAVENTKPVITLPSQNFLLLQDRSMYVSYATPLKIALGTDLIQIEVRPDPYFIKDFSPVPKDLTWGDSLLLAGATGGVALVVGFMAGVILVH